MKTLVGLIAALGVLVWVSVATPSAKYVFVASDGKVYQLANQHSKTIASHAGQEVKMTGELQGDTITAKKIISPVQPKK